MDRIQFTCGLISIAAPLQTCLLPSLNARVDQVKAGMQNGVLTITVPKEAAKKVDIRSIEISG